MEQGAVPDRLDVLRSSVGRLRALVEPLDADQLRASAYPTEWTVADVLSHIGSSTELMRTGVDDSVAGRVPDPGLANRVRDVWNAKTPEDQATDALAGDRAFVDRLGALDAGERARVSVALGPMMFGFDDVVGLRVNEHVVHVWDIAVTFDATETLPPEGTAAMIDNLGIVGRFWGKPIGVDHAVHVHTTAPERDFVVTLGMDAVTMAPASGVYVADLELPAEAFIRLLYGRLDADHSPVADSPALAELRRAYPGI